MKINDLSQQHHLLQSALQTVRPQHSLPSEFYKSPDIFTSDMQLIFYRHWLFIGSEAEVAEPGDYFTVDIGGNSVIIIRDDDDQINALHNTCCHRGARICLDKSGTVGKLVCPYHQWIYEPNGKLIMARNMGADFDVSGYALKKVHLRSIEGLLFICMADEPPRDIDTMAAEVGPYLRPHRLRDCKVAHQEELVELGNWKLTMENNRECYHCDGNHPELSNSFNQFSVGFEVNDDNREEYEKYQKLCQQCTRQWEQGGYPASALEHMDDRPTGYRIERLMIENAGESQTLDTKVASRKLMGNIDNKALGDLHFWTNPNSWHHFMSDHAVTFSLLPIDAERSLLRTTWLVHKDAQEGVDYDLENLITVWQRTNAQDAHLVAITQRGINDSGYNPGPYSPASEREVILGTNWYLKQITAKLSN